MTRYWRVRDCALEEAACQIDAGLRFHRRMQREAANPEHRRDHYQMAREAEVLADRIRGMKVDCCGHDHSVHKETKT